MTIEEAKTNLSEIVELMKDEIENNETNITAILNLEDLKSLKLILENSMPKEKVKEGLENIEDYFYRLNGPDEDIEYIRNIKQELLEENK